MAHVGVTCDGCGISNFFGTRFQCLVCHDYDLCHGCASNGVTSKNHEDTHPMQQLPVPGGFLGEGLFGGSQKSVGLVDGGGGFGSRGFHGLKMLRRERELSFGGSNPFDGGKSSGGLQCPCCSRSGMTEGKFFDHMMEEHRSDPTQVVCPLCHAAPQSHPSYRRCSLVDHLRIRHKRVSEKLQRQRLLRRLVRNGGPDAAKYTEMISNMDDEDAAKLIERMENGESISQVLASMKASKTQPAEVERSSDSLLRPITPTTDLDQAQSDRDRVAKAMFVQELLLSTLV